MTKSEQSNVPDLLPCPFCGAEPECDSFRSDIGGGDYRTAHRCRCTNPECWVRPCSAAWGESGYRNGDKRTDAEAKELVIREWNARNSAWSNPRRINELLDAHSYCLAYYDGALGAAFQECEAIEKALGVRRIVLRDRLDQMRRLIDALKEIDEEQPAE